MMPFIVTSFVFLIILVCCVVDNIRINLINKQQILLHDHVLVYLVAVMNYGVDSREVMMLRNEYSRQFGPDFTRHSDRIDQAARNQ